MSSRERRAQLRQEREEQAIRDEEEQVRLNARSLFEKIEDCETVHDVKRVLHEIVNTLDDCLASRGGFPPPPPFVPKVD